MRQRGPFLAFSRWADVETFLIASGHRSLWQGWMARPPLDTVWWLATTALPVPLDARDAGAFFPALACLVAWRQRLGPLAFKIGTAADPELRYHNDVFGYVLDLCWQFMVVLLAGDAQACRWGERVLIAALRGIAGCHNASLGGEGVSSQRTHECFVYAVVRVASERHRPEA